MAGDELARVRGCCGRWTRRTRSTRCPAARRPTRLPRPAGTAPEANTDIAIARNRRSRSASLVGLDAAAHAEADLVDVRSRRSGSRSPAPRAREQRRQVHRDEPRLGVVPVATCSAKMRNASLKPRPSSRSTTTFCRNITGVAGRRTSSSRRRSAAWSMPSMSFLRHRGAAADRRVDQTLVGKESLERAEHAVLGDGVGVLVGVRHARDRSAKSE